MPIYLRVFGASLLTVVAFFWAVHIAGRDVIIGNTDYGSTMSVATDVVDHCGCEPDPDPEPNPPDARALARDQLQPIVLPGGLALVSIGYLAWRLRVSVRANRAPFKLSRDIHRLDRVDD